MPIKVIKDDLQSGHVISLLSFHLEDMQSKSPPGSVHALDRESLNHPDLQFWSAWHDGEFAGCGGLKRLSSNEAEIKSMRTADKFQRRNVASTLLDSIIAYAASQHITDLYLETGSQPAFSPARKLYEQRGFVPCSPFADYKPDVHSAFYRLQLL